MFSVEEFVQLGYLLYLVAVLVLVSYYSLYRVQLAERVGVDAFAYCLGMPSDRRLVGDEPASFVY